MHHTHSRTRNGSGGTPHHARHRTKKGLLRGLLRQARRHPLATGAAIAAVGWLLSDNERHETARARRAARSQVSGAGRAINGEASHG